MSHCLHQNPLILLLVFWPLLSSVSKNEEIKKKSKKSKKISEQGEFPRQKVSEPKKFWSQKVTEPSIHRANNSQR